MTKAGNNKKYSRTEVNSILYSRSGDTLFSLFPTQETLIAEYLSAPNIRVFDIAGNMMITLCSDHFPELLQHLDELRMGSSHMGSVELGSLEKKYLNASEVFSNLPNDVRFLVFVPWSVRDTITIEKYSLNPFEDWFQVTQKAVEKLHPDFIIMYESKMRLNEHTWSDEEWMSAEYDLMRVIFPDQYE